MEQEYGLSVIATTPSVLYRVKAAHTGEIITVENPSDFPEANQIDEVEEPVIDATILLQAQYIGPIIALCQDKRGVQKEMRYLDNQGVILRYTLPLNEVAIDFYDQLKSISSGYASLDYELAGYKEAPLVKMDILLNGKIIDALSVIVHKDKAYYLGRELTAR